MAPRDFDTRRSGMGVLIIFCVFEPEGRGFRLRGRYFPWETEVVSVFCEVEESHGVPGEFAAEVQDEDDDEGRDSAAESWFTSATWVLVLHRALCGMSLAMSPKRTE